MLLYTFILFCDYVPHNEQFFIIPISLFIDIFTSYSSLNVKFYIPFDVVENDKLYNIYSDEAPTIADVITFQAEFMRLEPGVANQALCFQTGGHEIKTHRCHSNCVQAMWLKHSCIPGERKIIFSAHHFTLDCSDEIFPNKTRAAVIISTKQKKYSGTVKGGLWYFLVVQLGTYSATIYVDGELGDFIEENNFDEFKSGSYEKYENNQKMEIHERMCIDELFVYEASGVIDDEVKEYYNMYLYGMCFNKLVMYFYVDRMVDYMQLAKTLQSWPKCFRQTLIFV